VTFSPRRPPSRAVAIEGMSHCYGRRQALNDVTFSIAPSTFAVLLGNYETNLLAKTPQISPIFTPVI